MISPKSENTADQTITEYHTLAQYTILDLKLPILIPHKLWNLMFSSDTLDQIILNHKATDALLSAETEMKSELRCPQNVPDIPRIVSVIKRLYF